MRNAAGTLLGSQIWQPVNIGGLGYVTGLTQPADGTCMGARTDVGGAYRRETGTTAWTQIITSTHMTIPDPLTALGNTKGCFELAIAPSDATRWYMAFSSRILISTNRGVDWVDDSLNGATGLYMGANDQPGNVRVVGDKLTVDPTNPAVVYFGSQANGLWNRLSGAWTQNASLPASSLAGSNRIIIIQVDPTSSLTGSGATSRRSVVYASVSGQGIYKSTDGGTTFALMSGHPGAGAAYAALCLMCDSNGLLWLALDNGLGTNVWTWNGSAWTNNTVLGVGTRVWSIAQDIKTAGRYVGMAGAGKPFYTSDSGATWHMWQPTQQRSVAANVPIIASVLNATFIGGQNAAAVRILPHPTLAKDFTGMGLGVCNFDSPWPASSATTLYWNEDAAGIEELVANYVHITANGTVVVGSQDKALIRVSATGYPPSSRPTSALDTGFGIDSAIDNPLWIAGLANNQAGGRASAYSLNDAVTWTGFAAQPSTRLGGGLAVGNAGNAVVFPGQNAYPKYTTDSGATWATPTFTGWTMPTEGSENGWGFGTSATRRHIVCADKANAGTFYAYCYKDLSGNSRGLWKSTDSGATFARVNTGSIINALFTGFHVQLKMDRGVLYLCPGESGSSYDGDTVNLTYRSEDGGVTWTALGQLYEINLLGIGKPAPESALHTLYALGWKTISAVPTFGMYRSLDKGVTWTLLENNPTFDHAYAMAADPSKFGRVIVGYSGTGYAETNYDYEMLLKAA